MPVTDTAFAQLEARVTRLEGAHATNTETLTWLVGAAGGIKAVQDDHTRRLDRLERKVDGLEQRFDGLERKLDDLAQTLPKIVADAMREVLIRPAS